jgi:hypothetical protein
LQTGYPARSVTGAGDDHDAGLGEAERPCYLTGMPPRPASSADLNAVIARVTPDILALLGDGVPRSRGAILAALADRHAKADVRRTLMRLAVTEQLVETGGKYTLPPPGPEQS